MRQSGVSSDSTSGGCSRAPRRCKAAAAALTCAMLWVCGCASTPPEQVFRVWPPPPAEPRVHLVRLITGPQDLRRPSLLRRLGDAIAGPSRQRLMRPQGVAVSPEERIYVTDQELQGVHVFDLVSGRARFIARVEDLFLVSPVGVAVCGEQVAVSDSALREVYLLDDDGELALKMHKPGGFGRPTGLAFEPQEGVLYVVDTLANEVCVFDLSGTMVRRFGSLGTGEGRLNYPTHVFVDDQRRVYVTDSMNFRLQFFTSDGVYQGEVGQLGDASGYMAVPKGVGVDGFGHIYVVDSYLSNVQVFDRQGRFLLTFGEPGRDPGSFQVPTGMTVAPDGRVYVCDSFNSRVQVFKYIGSGHE